MKQLAITALAALTVALGGSVNKVDAVLPDPAPLIQNNQKALKLK